MADIRDIPPPGPVTPTRPSVRIAPRRKRRPDEPAEEGHGRRRDERRETEHDPDHIDEYA